MFDISKWDYYYNIEETELVRANLVYTPYVSPDKKMFCMSFNRDIGYHTDPDENILWTDELLADRFKREIIFHDKASKIMPVLKLITIDYDNRRIFLEWHGDDFLMQGIKNDSYEQVLPDWQEQWTELLHKMWSIGIYKISLHPNSWTVHNGTLIPFNWFFCFDINEPHVTIRSLLVQISAGRQEKLAAVLESNNIDLDILMAPVSLQIIAFNSFRHNYPRDLIDNILNDLNVLHNSR
jgi:hypothetical protein